MPTEIVLGVTGSIGAYKAADVVRQLKEHGCSVTCLMTDEAKQFITPLSLQVLSERKISTDLFSLEEPQVVHTRLADQANLILIAPATANLIGKLAAGLADDLLTCLVLATKAPVLLAPAMNVHMYNHPTVQENIKRLRRLGYHFIGPSVGSLACGYEAIGHLAEVEEIVSAALRLASPARAAGGGTTSAPAAKASARSKRARPKRPLRKRRR